MKSSFQACDIIWPTLIFHYNYENYHADKDELIKEIYAKSKKQQSDIDSNVTPHLKENLKESKFDLFEEETPAISRLRNFWIDSCKHLISQGIPNSGVYQFEENKKINCVIQDSWYHITNDKGFHLPHTHPVSWAGIFYVQAENCSLKNGYNTWYNWNQTNCDHNDIGGNWASNNSRYQTEPQEGSLVLFPGWVPHDALPYEGEKDRIVVSANTKFMYT